ncbi:Os01g0220150 [Oryza sativa Japonica Group]|uniref:Os01g0220150 protein n=1 Tax=Oryza sativa subsp. japonica TaxID=39947 RepID=A0A0N7KCK4_ORYSJ|nr:hypothetical protein EE612_001098 [Oryza sativa]BAS71065.1 Os01g0220150 [Oryza sativa Japonica Group]
MAGGETGEDAHERGVVVGGRLRLLVVVPLVGEVVVLVGAADDGAVEQVGVAAPPPVPARVPLPAAHERRAGPDGGDGRAAVVRLPRVDGAIADHVARPPRVAPQDVVHLRLGERQELRRPGHRPAAARAPHGAAGEVVGVDGEEERRAGDELDVVPPLVVQHSAGRPPDVVGGVLPEARAREEVRLPPVSLQDAGVLAGFALEEKLCS